MLYNNYYKNGWAWLSLNRAALGSGMAVTSEDVRYDEECPHYKRGCSFVVNIYWALGNSSCVGLEGDIYILASLYNMPY